MTPKMKIKSPKDPCTQTVLPVQSSPAVKVLIVNLLLILFCSSTGSAQCPVKSDFPKESLPYDVIYQWGFIWKRAASASLDIDSFTAQDGTKYYKSLLTARTLAFADRIFKVRDTLVSIMRKEGLIPHYYAKISDEDHTYRKDVTKYSYNNGICTGDITLYRPKRNAIENYLVRSSHCVYDMLSVFYYLRTIDFSSKNIGDRIEVDIFTGNHIEYLSVEYLGRTLLDLKGKAFGSYKIKLHFSDDKGKRENDNITAWISDDHRKIPIQVEGKLAIGSLKAIYTSK